MLDALIKFLLCSFVIHLVSTPNFWNEVLLLIVVCVCTWLCFVHINQIYEWILLEYVERLKDRMHPLVGKRESCENLCSPTPPPPTHPPQDSPSREIVASQSKLVKGRSSSSLTVASSQRDLEEEQNLAYRVDYFLTVSPSDYIRLDREKRKRDVRLESCYELTYLLEKVITKYDGSDKDLLPRKAIENNFNSIREKFKTEMSRKTSHTEFQTSSIQSLLIPIFKNGTATFLLSFDDDNATETSDKAENGSDENVCKERTSSTIFTKTSIETIIDISSVPRKVSGRSVPCRYDIF